MLISATLACGPSPPITENIKIPELYACAGPDINNRPAGVSDIFHANDDRIYACGRLLTSYPEVTLGVAWYYENENLFSYSTQRIKKGSYFYSNLDPEDGGFRPGLYTIQVFAGRIKIQQTNFRVVAP